MPANVDNVQSVIGRRQWGTASATALLIVSTVLGVLLMHSVTPIAAMPGSMIGGESQTTIASPTAKESSTAVAFGEHRCPTAHHMMHPCTGTTVSWSTLTAPAICAGIDGSSTSPNRSGVQTDFMWGRAPPWILWELDRSVTLRV